MTLPHPRHGDVIVAVETLDTLVLSIAVVVVVVVAAVVVIVVVVVVVAVVVSGTLFCR